MSTATWLYRNICCKDAFCLPRWLSPRVLASLDGVEVGDCELEHYFHKTFRKLFLYNLLASMWKSNMPSFRFCLLDTTLCFHCNKREWDLIHHGPKSDGARQSPHTISEGLRSAWKFTCSKFCLGADNILLSHPLYYFLEHLWYT